MESKGRMGGGGGRRIHALLSTSQTEENIYQQNLFQAHKVFLPLFQIIEEIDNNDIHIYEFPECDSDEDDDFKQQDRELKVCVHVLR